MSSSKPKCLQEGEGRGSLIMASKVVSIWSARMFLTSLSSPSHLAYPISSPLTRHPLHTHSLVSRRKDLLGIAEKMLGHKLFTKQTGPQGKPVNKVIHMHNHNERSRGLNLNQ